jgi:hypothetical protein
MESKTARTAWHASIGLLGCAFALMACIEGESTGTGSDAVTAEDKPATKKKTPASSSQTTAAPSPSSGGDGLSSFFGDDDDDSTPVAPPGQQAAATTATVTVAGLSPASATAQVGGTASLTLTVTGTGFDSTSVVVFNNKDVPTKLVSATSLQGAVPSDMLSTVGAVPVLVREGSTMSTAVSFSITAGTGASCGADFFTCTDLGLKSGQCTQIDGDVVQCEADGCVYEGCE